MITFDAVAKNGCGRWTGNKVLACNFNKINLVFMHYKYSVSNDMIIENCSIWLSFSLKFVKFVAIYIAVVCNVTLLFCVMMSGPCYKICVKVYICHYSHTNFHVIIFEKINCESVSIYVSYYKTGWLHVYNHDRIICEISCLIFQHIFVWQGF